MRTPSTTIGVTGMLRRAGAPLGRRSSLYKTVGRRASSARLRSPAGHHTRVGLPSSTSFFIGYLR